MKYFITLFWGLCIGQAVNYIGSSLTGGTYNFLTASLIGLIIGFVVILIGLAIPKEKENSLAK